jgi:hypothetical protein
VWYGGDWGLEEGASGVVVRLGVRRGEDHIGSAKTMRTQYDALFPLSERHRRRVRAPEAWNFARLRDSVLPV